MQPFSLYCNAKNIHFFISEDVLMSNKTLTIANAVVVLIQESGLS